MSSTQPATRWGTAYPKPHRVVHASAGLPSADTAGQPAAARTEVWGVHGHVPSGPTWPLQSALQGKAPVEGGRLVKGKQQVWGCSDYTQPSVCSRYWCMH